MRDSGNGSKPPPLKYFSSRARLASDMEDETESVVDVSNIESGCVMKWATGGAIFDLRRDVRGGTNFVKGHVQRSHAAQAEVLSPDDRPICCEREICGSTRERFKGKLAFDARQRRAKAEVTGPAKGEMPVIGSRQVQGVGIVESFRIAVAGSHDGD